MMRKLILIFFLFPIMFLVSANFCLAADPIDFEPQVSIGTDFENDGGYEIPKDTSMIAWYIKAIYGYAINIVGIIAVIAMMFGGFLWITAGGNTSQVDNAKSYIAASLTGLVLLLFSYVILKTVNPALVNFKVSAVPTVQETQSSTVNSNIYCCINDATTNTTACAGVNESEKNKCDGATFTTLDQCQKESTCATVYCCHEEMMGSIFCSSATLTDLSNCNYGNRLYYPTIERCQAESDCRSN